MNFFKKESLTISALATMLAVNILVGVFGVEISDESFTNFLQTMMTIVLGIVAWIGRVRAGGIDWLGRRK